MTKNQRVSKTQKSKHEGLTLTIRNNLVDEGRLRLNIKRKALLIC